MSYSCRKTTLIHGRKTLDGCGGHGGHVLTTTAALGVSTVNYFEYCGVKWP